MGLYERLMGEVPVDSGQKIPIHEFFLALGDFQAGLLTQAQVQAVYNFSQAEIDEVVVLRNRIGTTGGKIPAAEIQRVLLGAEPRRFYPTIAALKTRLGV